MEGSSDTHFDDGIPRLLLRPSILTSVHSLQQPSQQPLTADPPSSPPSPTNQGGNGADQDPQEQENDEGPPNQNHRLLFLYQVWGLTLDQENAQYSQTGMTDHEKQTLDQLSSFFQGLYNSTRLKGLVVFFKEIHNSWSTLTTKEKS